jgi:hypothetical protein
LKSFNKELIFVQRCGAKLHRVILMEAEPKRVAAPVLPPYVQPVLQIRIICMRVWLGDKIWMRIRLISSFTVSQNFTIGKKIRF